MWKFGIILVLAFSFCMCASKHSSPENAVISAVDRLIQEGAQQLEVGKEEELIAQTEAFLATDSISNRQRANLLFILSKAYYQYEENNLALDKIIAAYQLFQANQEVPSATDCILFKGVIHRYLNQWTAADSCFALATELAEQLQDTPRLYKALINRSTSITPNSRDIPTLERAYQLIKDSNDQDELLQLCQILASEHEARGQLSEAEFYYLQLLQLKGNHDLGIERLGDLRSLGGIYAQAGLLDRAQQQYIQALSIAEAEKDPILLAELATEMSALFIQSRMWSQAKRYAEKAIQLASDERVDLQLVLANNLFHLGQIAASQDSTEHAINYYRRSLDLFHQLGDHQNAAQLNLQLAPLEHANERLDAALYHYEKALTLKQLNNELAGILEVKMQMAAVLIQQKKEQQALKLLQESEGIAEQIQSKEQLLTAYEQIALLLGQQKDYPSAFFYQSKASSLRDSILNKKIVKATAELELKYNFDKQALEMAQRELSLQEKELENRELRFRILLISSIALGLILALLLYNWRRRQINQQKIFQLEKEKEAQRLRSIIMGEENERKRIASELHDGIGALLSTVKMQFNSLGNLLPSLKQQERFQKAETLLDDACDEVRRISHNMMPGVLEHYGLAFALQQLCQNINQSSNIDIEFIHFDLEKVTDSTLSLSIYRIIQELLKNVVQHAQAKEVIVQLTVEENQLCAIVEDDGHGFELEDVHTKNGIGLKNIQSRVTFIGGSMEIESSASTGSTFTIFVPILLNPKNAQL